MRTDPAKVSSAPRCVLSPLAAGLAGAALGAALLGYYGVGEIAGLLSHAGLGILLVILVHLLQLALTGAAWRAVTPPGPRLPATRTFTLLRWIRESVNSLIPTAQIGGIVASVRLLCRRGVLPTDAVAGTVADITVEIVTQIAFTLLGLAVLLHALGPVPTAVALLSGLVPFTGLAVALLAAQWLGAARLAERLADRLGWSRRIDGLHETLIRLYRRRRRLAWGAACHLLAWILGSAEICLALRFLGRPVGLAEGFAIESLGQMIRAVGFAIPGALGLQEGGYVLLCGLYGIRPELALALSLVKRARELALGVPGVLVWLLKPPAML